MGRAAALWVTFKAVVYQVVIAANQLLNTVVCGAGAVVLAACTARPHEPGYADETMSAHAFRSHRDGKRWGLLLMPVIDLVFRPFQRIKNHCEAAYRKEIARTQQPPEYRKVI